MMLIGTLQKGIANCLLCDTVSVRAGSVDGWDWLRWVQWNVATYRSSEFGGGRRMGCAVARCVGASLARRG